MLERTGREGVYPDVVTAQPALWHTSQSVATCTAIDLLAGLTRRHADAARPDSARLTLIDRFDVDGTMYIVARRATASTLN